MAKEVVVFYEVTSDYPKDLAQFHTSIPDEVPLIVKQAHELMWDKPSRGALAGTSTHTPTPTSTSTWPPTPTGTPTVTPTPKPPTPTL